MNNTTNSTINDSKVLLEVKAMLYIIAFGLIFSIIAASITIYKFKNKNASKTSILSAILFLSMTLFLPFIIGYDIAVHDSENKDPTLNFETQKKIIKILYEIINDFSLACFFVIFPLFKNLHLSGYETPQDKFFYGIKENICSYLKKSPFLILGLLVIICIYRDKAFKEKKNIYQKIKIYLNFYNILCVYFNEA